MEEWAMSLMSTTPPHATSGILTLRREGPNGEWIEHTAADAIVRAQSVQPAGSVAYNVNYVARGGVLVVGDRFGFAALTTENDLVMTTETGAALITEADAELEEAA